MKLEARDFTRMVHNVYSTTYDENGFLHPNDLGFPLWPAVFQKSCSRSWHRRIHKKRLSEDSRFYYIQTINSRYISGKVTTDRVWETMKGSSFVLTNSDSCPLGVKLEHLQKLSGLVKP